MSEITTIVRIKPLLNKNDYSYKIQLGSTNNDLIVNEKKKAYDLTEINKQHIFSFDKIYSDINSTDDIFNDIGLQMVDDFLKNINTTFFVFGQTGSGKTHTIMGDSIRYGFIKILLHYLYDMKKKIKVSVIEIYNDTCYDILNSNKSIYQREDSYGNIILKDITLSDISNKADINNLFNIININRKVGCSSQNNQSSRSHLQFKIESNNNFIKILDLAGSERASQSEFINRNLYQENIEINKSLLALKECIRALKEKNNHIPIRSSKLTKLLKESFTGKCNTYVLGTIAQEQKNIIDSMNTLNYMSDLKYIKKIEIQKLPEIIQKSISMPKLTNNPLPYNNIIISPNYKLLVRNKSLFDDYKKNQNIILKKIFTVRSTKKLKLEFIEIIDEQVDFFKKIKKNII